MRNNAIYYRCGYIRSNKKQLHSDHNKYYNHNYRIPVWNKLDCIQNLLIDQLSAGGSIGASLCPSLSISATTSTSGGTELINRIRYVSAKLSKSLLEIKAHSDNDG